ncbi:hypothetical protein RHO15_03330 [Utexia brackfieldae]
MPTSAYPFVPDDNDNLAPIATPQQSGYAFSVSRTIYLTIYRTARHCPVHSHLLLAHHKHVHHDFQKETKYRHQIKYVG